MLQPVISTSQKTLTFEEKVQQRFVSRYENIRVMFHSYRSFLTDNLQKNEVLTNNIVDLRSAFER